MYRKAKIKLGMKFIAHIFMLFPVMGETCFYFFISQSGSCQGSDRGQDRVLTVGRTWQHRGSEVPGVIVSIRALLMMD